MGVILATAGSAVGLGNIWRFPYMTGQNGGAAFIMIYFFCVLLLGIPCMVSEFIIGRHAGTNTARAYDKLGNGTPWKLVGVLGVLTGFLITGYYAVVSGWCMQYIYASLLGRLNGDTQYIASYFSTLSTDPVKPLLWTAAFFLITHLVIIRGVRQGIERASKLLMPLLFLLLLLIVVASCLLPGADKGMAYLLNPDFGKINSDVFLAALGQSFYSLSLAMGCVCTYASYFSRQTKLVNSAIQIGVIDSIVAVLAGLMIFPAAFSVGISPDSGPSLIFITLPNVFQHAFAAVPAVGYLVSLLFYILLSLAALTSLISLHEVSTAFFHEELHVSRKTAATVVSLSCFAIGAFCSLSLGGRADASETFTDLLVFGGRSLFDWFDFVTGQIFLPVGGFLTCLFIGWYVDHKTVRDEYTNWGTLSGRFFHLYLFSVKYICPACILLIFLHQLGVI